MRPRCQGAAFAAPRHLVRRGPRDVQGSAGLGGQLVLAKLAQYTHALEECEPTAVVRRLPAAVVSPPRHGLHVQLLGRFGGGDLFLASLLRCAFCWLRCARCASVPQCSSSCVIPLRCAICLLRCGTFLLLPCFAALFPGVGRCFHAAVLLWCSASRLRYAISPSAAQPFPCFAWFGAALPCFGVPSDSFGASGLGVNCDTNCVASVRHLHASPRQCSWLRCATSPFPCAICLGAPRMPSSRYLLAWLCPLSLTF